MAEQNTNAQATAQTQATQQTPQATSQTPNYEEIFGKLDAILDKRSEGLAKSALKDNGISADEISDIVKAYREQKQSRANEQSTALSTAQSRVAELEKQIADRVVDDALTAAALESGIDPKQLPYITRLAEREGILGEDGKPDTEKVKAAIGKILEDIPALKASASSAQGFQTVGNKTGGNASDEESEKKLRSWFGLK